MAARGRPGGGDAEMGEMVAYSPATTPVEGALPMSEGEHTFGPQAGGVHQPRGRTSSNAVTTTTDAFDYRRVELGGDLADFGSTTVCCGGRMILGPDRNMCLFSMVLIAAPMAMFLSFALRLHPAFFAVGVALIILSLGSLIVTGTTDPGIVPKKPPPPNPPPPEAYERQIMTAHGEVTIKWCTTCNLWRPERTSHCSDCGNCVVRFDHHCPWTGTCIGGRNYRYFCTFIASTTLLCAYVVGVSIYEIVDGTVAADDDNFVSRLGAGSERSHHLAAVVLLYGLCISCCVGRLCCYHSQLVLDNKTTHEEIKYVSSRRSPYDRGAAANCNEVFCDGFPSKVVRVLRDQK